MMDDLNDPTYFERSNEENKFKEYLLDFDKNRKMDIRQKEIKCLSRLEIDS